MAKILSVSEVLKLGTDKTYVTAVEGVIHSVTGWCGGESTKRFIFTLQDPEKEHIVTITRWKSSDPNEDTWKYEQIVVGNHVRLVSYSGKRSQVHYFNGMQTELRDHAMSIDVRGRTSLLLTKAIETGEEPETISPMESPTDPRVIQANAYLTLAKYIFSEARKQGVPESVAQKIFEAVYPSVKN